MLKDVLRQTKGCVAARCDDQIVRIAAEGKTRYATAARAIEALDPATVELLDASDAVLRILTLRDDDTSESDEGSDGGDTAHLTALAKVLGDVSDRAAQRHAEAYKQAFSAQTELVRLIADRLNSLERAWHKTILLEYQRATEDAAQADREESSMLDGALGEVIKLAGGGAKDKGAK